MAARCHRAGGPATALPVRATPGGFHATSPPAVLFPYPSSGPFLPLLLTRFLLPCCSPHAPLLLPCCSPAAPLLPGRQGDLPTELLRLPRLRTLVLQRHPLLARSAVLRKLQVGPARRQARDRRAQRGKRFVRADPTRVCAGMPAPALVLWERVGAAGWQRYCDRTHCDLCTAWQRLLMCVSRPPHPDVACPALRQARGVEVVHPRPLRIEALPGAAAAAFTTAAAAGGVLFPAAFHGRLMLPGAPGGPDAAVRSAAAAAAAAARAAAADPQQVQAAAAAAALAAMPRGLGARVSLLLLGMVMLMPLCTAGLCSALGLPPPPHVVSASAGSSAP